MRTVKGTSLPEKGEIPQRLMAEPAGPGLLLTRSVVDWVASALRRVVGLSASRDASARLRHVERIVLGPRQELHLVEADGVPLLVATSAAYAPVFFSLAAGGSPGPATPREAQSHLAAGQKESGGFSIQGPVPVTSGAARRARTIRQPGPRPLAAGGGFGLRGVRQECE